MLPESGYLLQTFPIAVALMIMSPCDSSQYAPMYLSTGGFYASMGDFEPLRVNVATSETSWLDYQQALPVQYGPVLGDMLKAYAAASARQERMESSLGAAAWPSVRAPPGLAMPGMQAAARKQLPSTSHGGFRNKERPKRSTSGLLIATHLNELNDEDPRKMLIVRKINRLGFASEGILKEYFGQFGTVEKVRLSNTHAKPASSSGRFRVRPSGIAYLVFEDAQAASNALAAGTSQVVAGVEIFVSFFVSRSEFSKSPSDEDMRDRASSSTTEGSVSLATFSDEENDAEFSIAQNYD